MSIYAGKKVIVIGLARSGMCAANLLKDLGAIVSATDSADNLPLRERAEDLRSKGIAVEIGRHTVDFIRGQGLAVVSPGVHPESLALLWAREFNIPVISEIELAWRSCPAEVIATTGTNGKTTVTTLIAEVLNAAGKKALALGNIGRPFSQEVRSLQAGDFVSLEVSSFQLETIDRFRPGISVILNLTSDHLDRYQDMSEYLAAKKRIFKNQSADDYLVLNYDQPELRALVKESKAKTIFFGKTYSEEFKGLDSRFRGNDRVSLFDNLNPNQLAVLAVCGILGVSREICLKVFAEFKGVEHRMEKVDNISGVDFINDSKATNVDSTVWALNNTVKPAILIAGGRDKNSDYKTIAGLIRQKVKLMVLIGEARDKIRSALEGALPIREASSLEEAVRSGFKQAKPGDCVLLSPMCASFDMFDNYEHRGKVFKDAVRGLRDKKITGQ